MSVPMPCIREMDQNWEARGRTFYFCCVRCRQKWIDAYTGVLDLKVGHDSEYIDETQCEQCGKELE